MPIALLAALALEAAASSGAPAQVTRFEPAFFADQHPQSAFDMVLRLPGFNLDYGSGARGFSDSGGNVRIDGQLPASRDSIETILRRIPAASVARIDLVTGGAPGIDMQGKAVIANVIRKTDGGVKGTAVAGAAIAQDGRARGNVSLQGEKRDGPALTEASAYYLQDLNGDEGPRVRGLTSPITSDFDVETRIYVGGLSAAREQPVGQGSLRLNTALTTQTVRTGVLDEPLAGAAPSAELDLNTYNSAEAGARYTRHFEGGASLQLTAFQQFSQSATASDFAQALSTSAFRLGNRRGESILGGTLGWPARGRWAVEAGAEGDYNWLDTATSLRSNGANVPLPAANIRVEETRGEAYANATFTPSPKVRVQGELRIEGSDIASSGAVSLEKTLYYFKPRLTATLTPAPGHVVVLRAERDVDQLSFGDFSATASLLNGTVVAGNPNLEPAVSTFYEASYERRFSPKASLLLVYNYRAIENVVGRNVFTSPSGTYEAADNVGPGVRQTLSGVLNLPLDPLGLPGGAFRGAIQFRASDITDPITGAQRVFSGEEPYSWRINLNQDIPNSRFKWGVEALKVGKTPFFLPSETDQGSRGVTLSATLDYRLRPATTLRIEGLNLLDRRQVYDRQVYSAPRDTGVITFREHRELRRELGGRSLRLSLTRTF